MFTGCVEGGSAPAHARGGRPLPPGSQKPGGTLQKAHPATSPRSRGQWPLAPACSVTPWLFPEPPVRAARPCHPAVALVEGGTSPPHLQALWFMERTRFSSERGGSGGEGAARKELSAHGPAGEGRPPAPPAPHLAEAWSLQEVAQQVAGHGRGAQGTRRPGLLPLLSVPSHQVDRPQPPQAPAVVCGPPRPKAAAPAVMNAPSRPVSRPFLSLIDSSPGSVTAVEHGLAQLRVCALLSYWCCDK